MENKKEIRFLKTKVIYNGKSCPVFYSKGVYEKLPKETITIYAKGFNKLPSILNPKNDSDIFSDYSEGDMAYILPNSKFYNEVLVAMSIKKKTLTKQKRCTTI